MQHLLSLSNRYENCNPIARPRALDPLPFWYAILGQPRINSLHATRIWPDELVDLFLHEILPIVLVIGIADFVQLALELSETRLG